MLLLCVGCGGPSWPGAQVSGPAADEIRDVVAAGDLIIVAGYRGGVLGEQNIEPSGDADAFIQAFNPDGSPLWEREFKTAAADSLEALLVSGDRLYAVGRTWGAFEGFTNAGQTDLFVVDMPLDGVGPHRLLQAGTEVPEHPVRIARDVEGALLIAGYDDIYVPSNYVDRWENTLTARVLSGDEDLPLDWLRHGETAFSDYVFGMAPTGVAGEMFIGGGQTGAEDGPYVRRLAANGSVLWNVRVGTVGMDVITAVEVGPDGNVYAAGATFQQRGATAFGQQDAFVVVLDPVTGNQVRAMQAGSADSDWPWDMVLTTDGAVYVAGGTLGAQPGFAFGGEQDPFVIRFDPQGRWESSWQEGGAAFEDVVAITLGRDGRILVAGNTNGVFIEGAEFGGVRDGFVRALSRGAFIAP